MFVLIFCVCDVKRIQIPSFIEQICSYAFNHCHKLQSVEIQSDSKLQTIEKEALFSPIEILAIPSGLVDLKKDWCFYTNELTSELVQIIFEIVFSAKGNTITQTF